MLLSSQQNKCDVCSINNKLCLKKKNLEKILEKYKHMKDWEWKDHKGNQQFFNFRKEFVDALLQNILIDLNCQYDCKVVSVGSNTLVSDYDLTVSGPLAPEIVDIFNNEFRRIFSKESAVVFDTNVYGASFMEELNFGNFTVFISSEKGKIFKYVANANDEQSQRDWALLKLYKSLKGDEIKVFKQHFKDIPKKYRKLSIKNDIEKRNIEYVNSLYEVSCLKKAMKASTEVDINLKQKYKNAISKANYYGSETYFTQGAFMHVVGEIQSKIQNIPITHQEYIDSYIENIGETLKGLKYDGNLTYVTIEYVSKYLSRAMGALIKIINMHEETHDEEKLKAVKKMYTISELIRTKVRGQKGKKYLKARYSRLFLKGVGVKTHANLRYKLLKTFYKVVETHNKIEKGRQSIKGGGKRGKRGREELDYKLFTECEQSFINNISQNQENIYGLCVDINTTNLSLSPLVNNINTLFQIDITSELLRSSSNGETFYKEIENVNDEQVGIIMNSALLSQVEINKTIIDSTNNNQCVFYVLGTISRNGNVDHSFAVLECLVGRKKVYFSFGMNDGKMIRDDIFSSYAPSMIRNNIFKKTGNVESPDAIGISKMLSQISSKGETNKFIQLVHAGQFTTEHLERLQEVMSHVNSVKLLTQQIDNKIVMQLPCILDFEDIFYRRLIANYQPSNMCDLNNSVLNCSGLLHYIFRDSINCNCYVWPASYSAPRCCKTINEEKACDIDINKKYKIDIDQVGGGFELKDKLLKIPKGTTLYHGTSKNKKCRDDFDDIPTWFSENPYEPSLYSAHVSKESARVCVFKTTKDLFLLDLSDAPWPSANERDEREDPEGTKYMDLVNYLDEYQLEDVGNKNREMLFEAVESYSRTPGTDKDRDVAHLLKIARDKGSFPVDGWENLRDQEQIMLLDGVNNLKLMDVVDINPRVFDENIEFKNVVIYNDDEMLGFADTQVTFPYELKESSTKHFMKLAYPKLLK